MSPESRNIQPVEQTDKVQNPQLRTHMLDLTMSVHGENWRCLVHLNSLTWCFSSCGVGFVKLTHNSKQHSSLSLQTSLPQLKMSLSPTSQQTLFNSNLRQKGVASIALHLLIKSVTCQISVHVVMERWYIHLLSTCYSISWSASLGWNVHYASQWVVQFNCIFGSSNIISSVTFEYLNSFVG